MSEMMSITVQALHLSGMSVVRTY